MGVLVDGNNKPSIPLKFPNIEPLDALHRYQSIIEICDSPTIEARGLIRKK
jgi:hypothetical protein